VTIVDTNVVSEGMKPVSAQPVVAWMIAQPPSDLFTTVVTQAEIFSGIEMLPAGKRKHTLSAAAERLFGEYFGGRILAFDQDAAREFAKVFAIRKAGGHPISELDAMIAAIARVHRATLATRNTGDFEHCGIRLVDPWAFAADVD
jgi:toxin FitB